jgi:hypothetical protein
LLCETELKIFQASCGTPPLLELGGGACFELTFLFTAFVAAGK